MSEYNAPLLSAESSDSYQPVDVPGNQPVNQSSNYASADPQYGFSQPIDPPINQSNQQQAQHPTYAQLIHQSYDPSTNQSINQPMYAQPAPHGYNPAMNQPMNQPINQPIYPAYGTAPVVTTMSIPVGQPGHIQTFGRWSDGLFDCFNSPMICVLSWLLPCYRWPTTIARLGLMSFAIAVLIYGGLYMGTIILSIVDTMIYGPNDLNETRPTGSTLIQLVISGFGLCAVSIGAYHRVKIRQRYQIVGTGFGDWCTYFWCSCCAIAQEARHVDRDYGLMV